MSGFEQCMSIQDDSTATFTKYIARLNESLAQLATVKLMSISEIYVLAALMGLHLSPSVRHERAYRDLMTFIDEGNVLTLEEVLKIDLKHSRDRPSTANAFSAVRAAYAVCTRACPLCCSRGRSPHPSSRNSSSAGSSHEAPAPDMAPSAWFMTMSTGTSSGLMKSTTPTLQFLKSTALARIRFFSNARSMTFLTNKLVMPSLQLLQVSPLGRQR